MSNEWNGGLPLASSTWGIEEKISMQSVIDSGHFTMGEHVRQAEIDFATYIGTSYSVMVNSGSSANLIALAALNFHSRLSIPKGSEIIVPMVSWSTTFYPVNQAGFKLVFVDVSDTDWNISLEAVKSAITKDTKAIFAVNLLGAPADLVGLSELCEERGLLLLEDNCESLGAEINDKKTGSFGIMGTHSTFFSHHICTMEGGFVTTDDLEFYQILLSLRAHGWTRNLPPENHVHSKTGDAFLDSYTFVLPGYNVRPLEIEGALGVEQIKKLPGLISMRAQNAVYLASILKNSSFKLQNPSGYSSWFGFGFVLDESSRFTRKDVLDHLAELKIETRPIVAGNFLKNPVLKHLDFRVSGSESIADKIHTQGFFVGNHHTNISEELNLLVSALEKFGE